MAEMILRTRTASAIIPALEQNFVDYAATCAQIAGGQLYTEPGLTWIDSGTSLSYFSGVFSSRLSDDATDTTITRIQHHFRERGLRMSWWITPSTRPLDLPRYLTRHGMRVHWRDVGMALGLESFQTPTLFPGVTIEQVRDEATMSTWTETFARGFALPPPIAESYRKLIMGVPPAQHPVTFYLARLDGKPIGTSALFCSAGVAGINEVSIIPSMRRRGIGLSITAAPLLDARARGYSIAVLQASGMGIPVYQRLGFASYCAFEGYILEI